MAYFIARMYVKQLNAYRLAVFILLLSNLHSAAKEKNTSVQFLNILINGVDTTVQSPVLVLGKETYISTEALSRIGINTNDNSIMQDQIKYNAITSIPNLDFSISEPNIEISCPSSCFNKNKLKITQLKPYNQNSESLSSGAGTFINYDLMLQNNSASKTSLNGYFQAGGSFSSSRWVSDGVLYVDSYRKRYVRLESSWIKEWSDSQRQLVLGDTISNVSAWARPFRFLGIKYGTDYSLQPDFIPYPLPNLTGDSSLPSIVDLIVNNQHIGTGSIPPGPFETGELPLMTGSSQVQMTVKDILGRESIIEENIYIAPQLLKKGLTQFTIQGGLLRKNFTVQNFDYDNMVVSGRFRYGLTNSLTAETYAETDINAAVVGGGISFQPAYGGVFTINSALNLNNNKTNLAGSVSYEYLAREWSYRIINEWRSSNFKLPSSHKNFSSFLTRLQILMAHRLSSRITLTTGYILSKSYTNFKDKIIHAAVSINPYKNLHININFRHAIGYNKDTYAGIYISMPLGNRRSISSSVRRSNSETQMSFISQQSPERTHGLGYRARIVQGRLATTEGQLQWRSQNADLNFGVSRWSDNTSIRANARGSIILWKDNIHLSRYLYGSFAMINAPKVGNVRVYHDSQYVGRLNNDGKLLVTNLRPFENNRITIEPRDLQVGQYLKSHSQTVRPQRNSGVIVNFGSETFISVVIKLVTTENEILTFGTKVTDSLGNIFVVGHKGRVNLRYPAGKYKLHVEHEGHICGFDVEIEKKKYDLGEEVIICNPVQLIQGK